MVRQVNSTWPGCCDSGCLMLLGPGNSLCAGCCLEGRRIWGCVSASRGSQSSRSLGRATHRGGGTVDGCPERCQAADWSVEALTAAADLARAFCGGRTVEGVDAVICSCSHRPSAASVWRRMLGGCSSAWPSPAWPPASSKHCASAPAYSNVTTIKGYLAKSHFSARRRA